MAKDITVFICGSTLLKQERDIIKVCVSDVNSENRNYHINIKALAFDTEGNEQKEYNRIIQGEADIVIFVIKDKINSITEEELYIASKRKAKDKKFDIVLFKEGDSNEGFFSTVQNYIQKETDQYIINYHTKLELEYRTYKYLNMYVKKNYNLTHHTPSERVDGSALSWANDNFAYLTIEARFKETYNLVFNKYKDCNGYISYDQFLDSEIYKKSSDTTVNLKVKSALKELLRSEDLKQYSGTRHKLFLRSIPFIKAEYYFYYYVLYQYCNILNCNKEVIPDPYREYKLKKLNDEKSKVDEKSAYNQLFNNFKASLNEDEFDSWLKTYLNMNSSDLSQLSINLGKIRDGALVIDDIDEFSNFVTEQLSLSEENEGREINIITDNCGLELISDLLLGMYLLKNTKISRIKFHIKYLPIFVSDTILSDVTDAINNINEEIKGREICNNLITLDNEAANIHTYKLDGIEGKYFEFIENDCWHMPTRFTEVDEILRWNDDNNCALVIIKGDLNYRRLVGDNNYRCTDSIADKITQIKVPLLIVRSLKSNVILDVHNEESFASVAPNWKTTGEFGIIQFINPKV